MIKLIAGALALLLGFVGLCYLGVFSDPFYYRDVEGCVEGIGSRFKGGGSGGSYSGQEKIALQLSPFTASQYLVDAVDADASGIFIECLSTKCAVLSAGTCAEFSCKKNARWTEPSVIKCKMGKVIPRDRFESAEN